MLMKNNKILVGCLALLLVIAVGYALFSETITINGTATAKGEFKVDVSCVKGINTTLGIDPADMGMPEGGYKNDSCTVSGNTVSFSAELEYPGAMRFFTLKISNSGTMDAIYDPETGLQVENANICLDGNSESRVKNGTIESDECTDLTNEKRNKYILVAPLNDYDEMQILGYEKADGTIIYSDDEEASNFKEGDLLKLSPGESFYMVVYALFPDVIEEGETSFLATQNVTENFTFKQRTTN